ncbi:MAG TPA: carboxypeptidase-like regulatory domain-containing protein [Gemmatimonadales bacterium]|nr:carboxypeptidase-like regulatory domain-containing protein [Gemmatimonadales bacterium]
MRRAALLGALALAGGCAGGAKSSMVLERHVRPLATSGPDALALPVNDRYRYGVVVGSVMTAEGERGCNGEVWLEPAGAPVRDVRTIAGARLQNMFRFPQLLPGRYELGVRCLGFEPVRETVEVRIGQVVRAVVTMVRHPERSEGSARS